MRPKTIIFPHIPKCGGTSLLSQLKNNNLEIFLDYEMPPHLASKFFQAQCERRNHEYSLLSFANFDIVYGHFPLIRYRGEKYSYVALLRDPLERAISQYFYWKSLPDANLLAIHRNPIITAIKRGEIDFLQFVRQQRLESYYSLYLNGFKPEDFALIGFLDKYDHFLANFSTLIGISLDSVVHMRKGSREELNIEVLAEAKDLLSDEYDLYGKYREFWL